MRIGFAGTPTFASVILDALLASKHRVDLVLTQPAQPAGRGHNMQRSPVETLGLANGLQVLTPTRLRTVEDSLRSLDVLVVAAYGKIVPKRILTAPRYGCVNVHASLLPRWRGASPIEHAILHGDHETGVTIMQMSSRLDAGPMIRAARLPLTASSTTASLTDQLAKLGGIEIVRALNDAEEMGFQHTRIQCESDATYAPKLTSDAAQIDWRANAVQVERHVRAFHGRGMAFTTLRQDGRSVRIRVLEAAVDIGTGEPGETIAIRPYPKIACGKNTLDLHTVQLNIGKGRPMSGADAVNGYPDLWRIGMHFDLPER